MSKIITRPEIMLGKVPVISNPFSKNMLCHIASVASKLSALKGTHAITIRKKVQGHEMRVGSLGVFMSDKA